MISLRTTRKTAVGERCDAIYARGLTHASAVEMRHFPTDAWRLEETYCNARWTSTCKKAGSAGSPAFWLTRAAALTLQRRLDSDAIDAAPRRDAIAATAQVYEATLTQRRKDDLERELPLLVVAERVQILLARELDHGRRAAHDD